MSENEQQQPGVTYSRRYEIPPWLTLRAMHVGEYWANASNAFGRASIAVGQPVFSPDEAIPPEQAARWRSAILGHALVALCSTLEALVRDTLTDWLIHTPAAWRAKRIADLKITVGDWMGKDLGAQARWVMTELWKSSGGPDRNPIARFEALFETFGIRKDDLPMSPELRPGGPERDDTIRWLTEMWAMRNVIVHQLGVVDAKFRAACPHLPFEEGQELVITHEEFNRYSHAATIYMMQVMHRLAVAYEQMAAANSGAVEV